MLDLRSRIALLGAMALACLWTARLRADGPGAFAYTDYSQGEVTVVSAEGLVEWRYPAAHCNDLSVLASGNLLFNDGMGVKEVTPERRVVFEYRAACAVYACQRLPNGNTFLGECQSGRLLEVSPEGQMVKEVRLLPAGKDGGPAFMRNARRLDNGHYLVAHYGLDVVREYDGDGRMVREIPAAGGPHSAERLDDGHTLVSCADHPGGPRLFEADGQGRTVWEVRDRDLPEAGMKFLAGFQKLPNGDIVVANWLGHGQSGGAAQLLEISPERKVVWSFGGHDALRSISSFRVMDPAVASRYSMAARVKEAALTMQRASWEQGVLATAFLEQGDDAEVVRIARASLVHRSSMGVPAASGGAPVDPLMAGEAVLRAARLTRDPDLVAAANASIEFALHGAPRCADGTIFHTGQTLWSDSFHTSPPLLAAAGRYDEAIRQIEGHRRRLWIPERRLMAHIWDEKRGEFRDPKAWGGGQGWAAAGLTRVIRALPPERRADRERLAGYLKELVEGCLAHQRPSGLFGDVVDDPRSFEETNLAQMLAYSLFEGVRGGWLPKAYLPKAQRMRLAARAKVDPEGFVRGVCGAPHFDQPGISAEGQAFFLMMEAAAAKAR